MNVNKQQRLDTIFQRGNHSGEFRNISLNSVPLFFLIIFLSGCTVAAQNGCEWTSFHGPGRTNKSMETGLLKEWPDGGPELLFTVKGLGEGYSTVSIADGRIYTAGMSDGQAFVCSFDLNGKLFWKKPAGRAWSTTASYAMTYTGTRSTPTYYNGVLYYLGETGRLTAWDAKTGKELWFRELMKDFDAPLPEYGYAESVLVDGDDLYVRPAGKKGFQVKLNRNNGATIWANTEIPGTEGYSSMVLMDFMGYRQIIGSSSNCYYGVDTGTGKLLWKVDFENQRGLNITDVVIHNEYIFITSGYGKGSMLFRLTLSGGSIAPETVWQSTVMDNHHGGVIFHDGFLYGSGSNSRGWFCLDFFTGKEGWKVSGKGSVTFADGMLYTLDERGLMKLVLASPEKYEVKGEFKVPKGGESMYWAHPVVCGGRLYIRHGDHLYAYAISGK